MFSFHPKSEEIDVFAQSSIFLWILIEEARIHDRNLKRHTNLNIQIIVQRQLWDVLQTRAYILLQCINIIESKTNDWIVGKMCEKVPINYRLISTKNSYTNKSQRQRTYYGCLYDLDMFPNLQIQYWVWAPEYKNKLHPKPTSTWLYDSTHSNASFRATDIWDCFELTTNKNNNKLSNQLLVSCLFNFF